MAAEIEALGYVGLEVSDLPRWRSFATETLGLQACDRPGRIDLRMDAYASRVQLSEGPLDDLSYVGWEVSGQDALEKLETRLRAAGVAVSVADAALLAERRVAGLISFCDPEGNRHEAFYGPLQRADKPFVSPLGVAFKTGRQGLGHIVLSCLNKAAMMAFFIDTLGFRLSDHIRTEIIPGRPMEISFLRCNGRHHSLALAPVPIPKKIVHLMFEVLSLDDVGRALYKCMADNVHLSFTLGRHSNDEMLSFYPVSPSGFDIEYGWGGLEVDDESWHVLTHETNSAWGHIFQRPPRPAPPETK
jgi:2,3-dihydroxybiphenyl 1,2-dioxygenase